MNDHPTARPLSLVPRAPEAQPDPPADLDRLLRELELLEARMELGRIEMASLLRQIRDRLGDPVQTGGGAHDAPAGMVPSVPHPLAVQPAQADQEVRPEEATQPVPALPPAVSGTASWGPPDPRSILVEETEQAVETTEVTLQVEPSAGADREPSERVSRPWLANVLAGAVLVVALTGALLVINLF